MQLQNGLTKKPDEIEVTFSEKEIKEFNTQNIKNIELNVLKNSYSSVLNSLSSGEVLYKRDENYNIIKICRIK